MANTYSVIDWIFSTIGNLWSTITQSWVLSVPILLCIFVQIFYLIKGIYSK